MSRRHKNFRTLPGSTKPVKFRGAIRDMENSTSRQITPEYDDIEVADMATHELLLRGNHWEHVIVIESSFTGPSGVTIWNLQRNMNYPTRRSLPVYAGEGI